MINIIIPKLEELPEVDDQEEVRKIYPSLCKAITECARVYHNKSTSLISDGEYDDFVKFLELCEATYPDIKVNDTPTELVGFAVTMEIAIPALTPSTPGEPSKYFHERAMLSLSKVHTEEELVTWLKKTLSKIEPLNSHWIVEGKVDGIAIKLAYEEGKLTHVVSRGDSHFGDDYITMINYQREKIPNFKIKGLPFDLTVSSPDPVYDGDYTTDVIIPPEYIEIIGEFVITKKDFLIVNQLLIDGGKRPYATQRHAAAGLVEARSFTHLTFVVHGVGEILIKGDTNQFVNYREVIEWLRVTCNFYLVGSRAISMTHPKAIEYILDELKMIKHRRNDSEIDLDGAVVKVDSFKQRQQLGETDKYPRWAIAFKYPSVVSTTAINGLVWQIGRTGVLTPVALLDPVTISNVVYSRVTLNNPEMITTLDIRKHDTVFIQRAGDVIPRLIGVVPERRVSGARKFKIPSICPECYQPTEMIGKRLYCTNRLCSGRALSILAYAVSKPVFNLTAIAIKTLEALYKCGLVHRPEHLFQLTNETLKEHFRSTENKRIAILEAAEQVRQKLTIPQVLLSLSIPNLSKVAVAEIEWRYRTIDKLVQLADGHDPNRVPSTIEKTAYWKSMMEYFQYPEVIESLHAFEIIMLPTTSN